MDKKAEELGKCNYHLCDNTQGLIQCRYCKDYFCEKHIRPTVVGMPRFRGSSNEDRAYMEEWSKPGGHPCIPYVNRMKTKSEMEKKQEYSALNYLIENPSLNQTTRNTDSTFLPDYIRTPPQFKVKKKPNDKNEKKADPIEIGQQDYLLTKIIHFYTENKLYLLVTVLLILINLFLFLVLIPSLAKP